MQLQSRDPLVNSGKGAADVALALLIGLRHPESRSSWMEPVRTVLIDEEVFPLSL